MGSCAAPSAKGDDKFITTDYLQQCRIDINVTRTIEPDAINVSGCFQFRCGIGVPCQRPGDPAVESLACTPCVSRAQQGDLFTAGTEFS